VVWKTQAGTTSIFAGELPSAQNAVCPSGSATTVPTTTPLAYPVALAQCNGDVFIAAEGIDPFWLSGAPAEVGGTVDEVDTNGNLSTLPLPLPPSGVGLHPVAIACDASGNVYVSSYFNPAGGGGIVGNVNEFSLTSSGWTTSPFATPAAGDVYPAIAFNPTTEDLDGILATGAIEGWLGSPNLLTGMIWDITKSASGLGSNNNFTNASALAIDPNGNFYVAQATSNTVPSTYVVFVPASTGTATPIAGNGSTTYNGSGILSTNASLDGVTELALDSTNNDIYLADSINDVVQRIHSLVPGPSTLTVLPTGVAQSSSATYGSLQGALNPATGDFYYVTGANTVNVINTNIVCPSCSRIVATIPVGANSGGSTSTLTMAIDSTRNRVYVSNTFDGNLYAIDGSTYTVTGSAHLGNPNASLLAVDTGTNEIYAGGPNATGVSALGGGLAPNGSELTLIGNYGYPVNSLSVNSPSADAPTHVLYAVADSGAGAGVTGEAFITMTPDPSTGALAVSAVAFPLQFAETVSATPGFIANSIVADPVSGSLFASGAASTDSFIEYYIYDFDQFTTPLTPYIQYLNYGWPPITTSLDIPNRVLYTTDFDGNVSDPSSHAEMVYRIDGEAADATYPASTVIPVFGSGTPTSPHVYDAEPDTSSYQAWISASDSSGGFVSLWDAGTQTVTASTIPSPSLGGGHLFVNPSAQDAYLLDHVNGQLWLINTPSWTTTPSPTMSQAANLQSVTISAAGMGDSVYYTLDGTAPGLGSTACSPMPCMVAVTTGQYTTINAIEVSATSGAASDVEREVFTAPALTTLGLGLGPANPTTGATLILTATIAPTTGVSPVTGTVSFAATPPNLSTPVTLLSCSPVSVVNNSGNWQAVCPFVEAAPGSYIFTASYSGDPLNQPSSSNPYPAIVNAGTTPVLGSVLGVSNALAINSNYPPAGSAYALNSYSAVLNSDSSVDLLLGNELTGLSCPPIPGMSGSSGAVYVDYANNIIYVAMVSPSALYAGYESIDPTTGVCTQVPGTVLNLTPNTLPQGWPALPSPPLGSVEMNVEPALSTNPTQGNMYLLNYRGAFPDRLYILPTPWSASVVPTLPLTMDYSVQYGPIVIDPSNDLVYINDLGGTGCGTSGTCATSGFFVYDPNQSATPADNLQHVVGYNSGGTTPTPFYVGTLLTNGTGELALVNNNPNASTTNLGVPITIINTNQAGFSFFANTSNPYSYNNDVDITPGAALSNISAASLYYAIGGADIDGANNDVYVFGYTSTALANPGLLLEYNLAAGLSESQVETVLNPSTALPSSSAPWSQLNYDPESTELALSASPALDVTSQRCLIPPDTSLTLTKVAPSANSTLSPGYPVVNATSGYVYAIDSNSGGIDFVAPPPSCPSTTIVISPSSLPTGAVGSTYLHTLTASGGSGGPYMFSATVASGQTGPPPGLSLLNTGSFSGAPTAAGTFTFTVQATDSSQKNTATATYTLIINPALSIMPATLPAGIVGGSYPQTTLSATGGLGPYTWGATGLPPGLGISSSTGTEVLSGTPTGTLTAAATFTVTLTVTDSQGNTATQNDLLTIYPVLTITPTALPPGTVGTPYSQTLTGLGGSGPPYTFTVASGTALSAVGLSLSSAGLISGTPYATETEALFTVQVADSLGDLTQGYALTINASGPTPAKVTDMETITVTDSEAVNAFTLSPPINVGAPVAFFSTGTPLGFGGQSGSQQTIAVSNIGQVSMTLASATISSGAPFTLSAIQCFSGAAASGAASATLPSGGFCTLTITYTGSSPATDAGTLTFTDNAALSNLTTVTSGSNYTQSVALTGSGTSTAPPAAPPATVPVPDNESITVTDTDSVSTGPIITTTSPLPTAFEGMPYNATINASSGTPPYTWSVTGQPSWLTINASTGVLSGTPSAAGTTSVNVTVTDSATPALSFSANLSLTVAAPAPIASLSPTLLVFAPQAKGTTSPAQTVTLTNTGTAALAITGGTGISILGTNAADFSQTSPSCSTPIAAGSNCTISVTFTPSSTGAEAATLNVLDNASGSPQQVGLTGTAILPPSVSCTIPTINFSGDMTTAQISCTATNYTGDIALVCNLPTQPSQFSNYTCSFSPSSLNFASSSTASTTLTIQAAQSASLQRKSRPWAVSSGGVALGAVLWLPGWVFVARRKKGRSKRGALLLMILLCGLPMITSCVGHSKGPATPPAGTYQGSMALTGPDLDETLTFTIQVP
jgi:hypothetical protein